MAERTNRPTLSYVIICDDVRQEVNEKISLMGLFDNIYVQTFPAVHPRLAAVAAWTGARGDFKSEMQILDSAGNPFASLGVAPIKSASESKLHRHIALAFNLTFKIPGTYQVKVMLDGDFVRTIPLVVERIGKPQ